FSAFTASLVLAGVVGAADGPVVTVTQKFAGLNDVVSGKYAPPDVQVAAGPGFVVELVNLAERVWRTDGGSAAEQVGTEPLDTFFASSGDRPTDPRLLYDAPSRRSLPAAPPRGPTRAPLAASRGSAPTARRPR